MVAGEKRWLDPSRISWEVRTLKTESEKSGEEILVALRLAGKQQKCGDCGTFHGCDKLHGTGWGPETGRTWSWQPRWRSGRGVDVSQW